MRISFKFGTRVPPPTNIQKSASGKSAPANLPSERRAIHQQSAQEVGIWAGRGWRALRPVRQSVLLRKMTVESSACVARRQGSIR